MKLSDQQLRAMEAVESGRNVFLTGMAGTGKSAVTAAIIGRAKERVDLCATTGIAALNLQQQFFERTGLRVTANTIYRFAGIALGPAPGQKFEDYFFYLERNMTRARRGAFTRVAAARTVVIDEISMLPGRILHYLDYHFRRIRQNEEPFGGVQIVTVGDFLQLPPVSKTGVYDWAFRSPVWAAACFETHYLTRIFRQNEPALVSVLNNFREGRVDGRTAQVLASRIARFPDRNIPRLFTHNVQVDKWNSYQLANIEEEAEWVNVAETQGDAIEIEFLIKNLVTPTELILKKSARVMFTANITQGGALLAANGECGTVLECAPDSVLVRKDTGEEVDVEPFKWQFDPQNEDSSTFTQFPLRLAYALTIHKSQGLTLDRALIDIRAAREPGQAYVALSRVRRLSGLFLKDWFKGVFVSPEAIEFYRNIKSRPNFGQIGMELGGRE